MRLILHTPYIYYGHTYVELLGAWMGDMVEQKLATMNSFQFFGRSFSTHPSHDILNKHNIKETDSKGATYGVHFNYPKVGVWVVVEE